MAQARSLEAPKSEVDERLAEVIVSTRDSSDKSNLYAKSLQEVQVSETSNLETKMKSEVDSAILGLKKDMDTQFDEISKLVKAISVSTSVSSPSGVSSPSSGVVAAGELVKSSLWVKVVGSTSTDGEWNSVPETITKSGKKPKGLKRWMLLEEHVFADMDRKDRDKVVVPTMDANCYWHPSDYLKFTQTVTDYHSHGGKKTPSSWGGASWDRLCTSLSTDDPL